MSKPETLKDLMLIGDTTLGDVKKVAAALWKMHGVASDAFPGPYKLTLPEFDSLPGHVQDFIAKGLLDAKVTPALDFTSHPYTGEYERVPDEEAPPALPKRRGRRKMDTE